MGDPRPRDSIDALALAPGATGLDRRGDTYDTYMSSIRSGGESDSPNKFTFGIFVCSSYELTPKKKNETKITMQCPGPRGPSQLKKMRETVNLTRFPSKIPFQAHQSFRVFQ